MEDETSFALLPINGCRRRWYLLPTWHTLTNIGDCVIVQLQVVLAIWSHLPYVKRSHVAHRKHMLSSQCSANVHQHQRIWRFVNKRSHAHYKVVFIYNPHIPIHLFKPSGPQRTKLLTNLNSAWEVVLHLNAFQYYLKQRFLRTRFTA